MKKLIALLFLLIFWNNSAQDLDLKSQVRHTIDELREFVAIPNDALDHSDINRNLSWLTKKFNERGFNSSVLPTEGESRFFWGRPQGGVKKTNKIFFNPADINLWGFSVFSGHWLL